ncbi:MAG: c-type cytochrome [Gemmatimonadota bacterium]|nr:c-type cytochrome [Gemmatimonadota bacterium]MDH5758286.1 c-type cytochrome [Gemmatimonadota bacterium]
MAGHDHTAKYRKIYFTLLALLVVSVAGPFLEIFWVTLITAFGIALVKANMVIQNFMHLREERRIMKWMLATSVILMFLFFAGVAPDVMKHRGTNWVNVAAEAAVERGIPAPYAAEGEHGEAAAEHEPAAEHEAVPVEAAPAEVAQAFDPAAVYATACSLCHGSAGMGDGPGGAAFDPPPADFTDPAFWAERTDELVFTAIKGGGGAVGRSPLMPPWGGSYSDDEIRALVEYIKGFSQ